MRGKTAGQDYENYILSLMFYKRRGVLPSAKVRKQAIAAIQGRADQRAKDLAATIAKLQAGGAESLRAIAAGLTAAGISPPRGIGEWSATQVQRTLARL